jgi:acyl-CoA dehydrogenase
MSGPLLATVAVLLVLAAAGLLYAGLAYWAWVAPAAGALALWAIAGGLATPWAWGIVTAVLAALALLFGAPTVRRRLVTRRLVPLMRRMTPRIGATERAALEAGTVWWEGELFSGAPRWRRLLEFTVQPLSAREREFLQGPVERLCAMLDEWQIERAGDLPPEVWAFLRRERFFGLIIPERYGGLGFSAAGHSAVVTKLASRSTTATVTVMVPSSLGPAELLLQYGTDEQKQRYLPALARGDEMPCFALTEPEAGSDAAAIQSVGVVCRGRWQGREVLGMRLDWDKRYITLAPVATLIGLAFRLRDPERLLGDIVDLGITCALVPADLPGIEIGARHDPLGVPFQNGPTRGRGVFVPLDAIIGGPAMAGRGWRMLMETLAAGRSISLPSLAVGGAELCARIVGAYATIRHQFDLAIGRFEGVEEPLARIAGRTYRMSAARRWVVAAVDAGERPAVLSAIAKAYLTESLRQVANDAMDIRAGAAICRGPRNVLARTYASVPIGITVEGANILTRTLIVFGQGAIRCHPFARDELRALAEDDLIGLDRALFGPIGHVARNAARSLLLGLPGGALAAVPRGAPLRRELQRLARASAAFALVADAAMLTLGGELKRREKLGGRLADALAHMALASAAIKQFADDGRPERDLPLVRWAVDDSLAQVQDALLGTIRNLPHRPVAALLRALVFPLGARWRAPDDRAGARAARCLLDDHEARRHLTRDIYLPPAGEPGLGQLEQALARVVAAAPVTARVRQAQRRGELTATSPGAAVDQAANAGLITAADRRLVDEAEAAALETIQVDAFPADAPARRHVQPVA